MWGRVPVQHRQMYETEWICFYPDFSFLLFVTIAPFSFKLSFFLTISLCFTNLTLGCCVLVVFVFLCFERCAGYAHSGENTGYGWTEPLRWKTTIEGCCCFRWKDVYLYVPNAHLQMQSDDPDLNWSMEERCLPVFFYITFMKQPHAECLYLEDDLFSTVQHVWYEILGVKNV